MDSPESKLIRPWHHHMAMSARHGAASFVRFKWRSEGRHINQITWRTLAGGHPEPFPLGVQSGAMATAERFKFRRTRNYVARMRGPQSMKLALDLTRTNTPRNFPI